MDKATILQNLESTGEINKKSNHQAWKDAFELYKSTTKDNNVSMECGVCFSKVLKWLRA